VAAATSEVRRADYTLTYWTRGATVLFTDIAKDMYKALGPLLFLHDAVYWQFFENARLRWAEREGIAFMAATKRL